jgi:3-hydroxyisobutyrate dehydrogenase
MGGAIARDLLRAGLAVTVWNRTRERAAPLAKEGAEIAPTPREAAARADIVLTMLTDWPAVEAAVTGSEGALSGMRAGTIWLQLGTVGSEAIERAAELAEQSGVTLVDGAVSGTKQPAERGELIVLVAGPEQALDSCEPIFGAIGQKTVRLGEELGRASAFKLVLNTWLIGFVESLAEAIALSRALGFAPKLFLETIAGGALDSSYAQLKGGAMSEEEFPPSFPVRLARKDAALVLSAAQAKELELPALGAAFAELELAEKAGLGDDDIAAVVEVVQPAVERRA